MVNKCQTQLVLCVLLKLHDLHGICAILTVMIHDPIYFKKKDWKTPFHHTGLSKSPSDWWGSQIKAKPAICGEKASIAANQTEKNWICSQGICSFPGGYLCHLSASWDVFPLTCEVVFFHDMIILIACWCGSIPKVCTRQTLIFFPQYPWDLNYKMKPILTKKK